MQATFTQKVKLSPDALFQEVAGEVVIMDLKSESYFGLDEVGGRIWQLMQQHGDLQIVFEVMLDEFDVEPDQLEVDMKSLLGELTNSGLIVTDDHVAN